MKIWIALISLIGFLIFGPAAIAQTANSLQMGQLAGTVSDAGENAPISYAFVLIHRDKGKDDVAAKLDSRGQFSIRLSPGLYDVFVAASGFAPNCKRIRITTGQTTTFEIALRPDSEHQESRLVIPHLNSLEVR